MPKLSQRFYEIKFSDNFIRLCGARKYKTPKRQRFTLSGNIFDKNAMTVLAFGKDLDIQFLHVSFQ